MKMNIKMFFSIKNKLIFQYAKVRGYSFRQAMNESDHLAAAKLRYQIYADEKYIDKAEHPTKVLVDKYAPYSNDILVFYRGSPVGTIRITHDSTFGFPTENLFNIDKVRDRDSTIELGRLVIDNIHRHKTRMSRLAMFGLAYLVLRYSIEHNIRYWIANMPEKLAKSFKQFGATLEKIPEKIPTPENIQARAMISGYFKKYTLFPYMICVNDIGHRGTTVSNK